MTAEAAGPGFATLALHAGAATDPAPAMPLDQSHACALENAKQAATLFGLEGFGGDVFRGVNPTNALLEERIAALEGGTAALAVASGRAAKFLVLHMLLEPGDEVVAGGRAFGSRAFGSGAMRQIAPSYKNFGWGVRFADPADPDKIEKAVTSKTKAIYVESFSCGRITDIAAIAKIASKARLPLIVDNTLPTPYLIRPLEHGADIVIHSATRFLGGHDSLTGGLIVDGGTFFWEGDERFPLLSSRRPEYGGLVFSETYGNFAFAVACRILGLNELGPALSPFNGFLILSGLETLALRMQRHSDSALRVAEHLAAHAAVSAVDYPGLASDPSHGLVKRYCPQGAGPALSFRIAGGYHAAVAFMQRLKLFLPLGDIGDTRSRACHPASTTQKHLSDVEKDVSGAGPDVIKLSIGLEDVADIIADLDQALATA